MQSDNTELTKRESEVAVLVGQGLTNPEVAQRLNISKHTVKHYLTVIYQKLDIQCRYQLIHYVAVNNIKIQHGVKK